MGKIFVKNIKERDIVETTFLVREKILGMAKNGRSYLTLKLMDASGEVEGRIWDQVDEISARFDKDDFVEVSGKASVYMGKMQLVIHQLNKVDESEVHLADFLPVTRRPENEMLDEFTSLVEQLQNQHLGFLLLDFQGVLPFL